jgi:hypothetical protein
MTAITYRCFKAVKRVKNFPQSQLETVDNTSSETGYGIGEYFMADFIPKSSTQTWTVKRIFI